MAGRGKNHLTLMAETIATPSWHGFRECEPAHLVIGVRDGGIIIACGVHFHPDCIRPARGHRQCRRCRRAHKNKP